MVQAPAKAGAPAPKKEKGNQAEALRSRAEPSASLSSILEPVSTKHHINQNAEAKLSTGVCATMDGLLRHLNGITDATFLEY